MNRAEFKRLSFLRLKEAKLLNDERCYSGAYYLSGYAVECALKACIAKKTKKSEFPDLKAVQASHVHDLISLIRSAGLELDLNSKISTDRTFGSYWTTVKDWSEKARYRTYNQTEAQDLLQAISDPTRGVLLWIQHYW